MTVIKSEEKLFKERLHTLIKHKANIFRVNKQAFLWEKCKTKVKKGKIKNPQSHHSLQLIWTRTPPFFYIFFLFLFNNLWKMNSKATSFKYSSLYLLLYLLIQLLLVVKTISLWLILSLSVFIKLGRGKMYVGFVH